MQTALMTSTRYKIMICRVVMKRARGFTNVFDNLDKLIKKYGEVMEVTNQ